MTASSHPTVLSAIAFTDICQVVQEFVVAKSLLYLCGNHVIEEADMMNASAWIVTIRATGIAPWSSNPLFELFELKSEVQLSLRRPLIGLIDFFRYRHATEPEDKLWSLYKLAADGDVRDCPTRPGLEADYNLKKEEVFTNLTSRFLRRDRNLDIVGLAGRFKRLEPTPPKLHKDQEPIPYKRCSNLPSWVPDLASPDSTISVQLHSGLKAQPGLYDTRSPFRWFPQDVMRTEFWACGTSSFTPPSASYDYDNGLPVRGIRIDAIRAMGDLNLSILDVPDQDHWHIEASDTVQRHRIFVEIGRVCGWMDLIGAESGRIYFTGENMMDVFWQTMRLGNFQHGYQKERQDFYEWYQKIRGFMKIYRTTKRVPIFGDYFRNDISRLQDIRMAVLGGPPSRNSFTARTQHLTSNRAMFTSTRGFVGMAVNGSEVGDEIAIFERGKVPFITRKPIDKGWVPANHWEIVGACYLHGCMYGQVFDPRLCTEMILV